MQLSNCAAHTVGNNGQDVSVHEGKYITYVHPYH